ncbi:MAG TPA: PKD domain-containing protein [Euryarchaeota archaeon]|nr:PKD domain-containing protein [Euryarchaeota archaeon]
MFSSFRHYVLVLFLISAAVGISALLPTGNDAYSNEYLFEEATDIYYDTNPRFGDLDSVNTRDVYRIVGLIGDDQNGGAHAQRLVLSLTKTDGANVEGFLYEPNGRPLARLYSDGEISDIEFFVPYDGDYFLEVVSDPPGSSSSYSYQMGGQQDENNNLFDGNNKPGATGFSGSKEVGGTLHPTHDIVDYHQFDLQPNLAVEVSLITNSPFKLDILNSTEDLLSTVEPGGSFERRNDGPLDIRLIFRIYLELDGNTQYVPVASSYSLRAIVWSFTTIPQINGSDPWPERFSKAEDHSLEPPLNLSTHFIESGGDPLGFEITSSNTYLDVRMVNHTVGKGQDAWNYTLVEITPMRNWYGEEVVSFRAYDRDGSVTDSFIMEIREVDDLPFITRIGGAVLEGHLFNMYGVEDTTMVYTMEYGDDDDPLEALSFTTNATHAEMPFLEVFPNNGTVLISPLQEHVGSYLFNITLEDGRGGYFIVDVALSIEPRNDPPTLGGIEIISGNMTLLPSETITLWASSYGDPDTEDLIFTWDWGDGSTSTGETSSHVYSTSHSGNVTITLTVSDGEYTVSRNLTIYVEAPEDIAKGNLEREISDPEGDAVKTEEEWKTSEPETRVFRVSTLSESGVDILSLRTQRRGNTLQILLDVKDSVIVDGSVHYHVFVVRKAFSEEYVDFSNLSSWDQIPSRLPEGPMIISSRSYLGDSSLNENSTGKIMDKGTLVWTIPFQELTKNGLEYPIDPDLFDVFAVAVHEVPFIDLGGLAERYIVTDTCGEGALTVGEISPLKNGTGSSSSPFGDFARPSNLMVVAGILVILVIFGVVGFVLVRKQRKEKEREEREFLEHIERLKKDGKDPFGKKLEEEIGPGKVSYEELYGAPKPEGHVEKASPVDMSSLPGPGLGGNIPVESNVSEMKIGDE